MMHLFTAMAIQHELATGDYSIEYIGEDEQQRVSFKDNDMYYQGSRVLGVALVR